VGLVDGVQGGVWGEVMLWPKEGKEESRAPAEKVIWLVT